MTDFDEDTQRKIKKVLEYYLSLHEADTIWNMIDNWATTEQDIEDQLRKFDRDNRDSDF